MRWAHTAALLAFASAAVTLYWTLGGTALLDTVGGEFEELARDRSAGAIALGTATVAAKKRAEALSNDDDVFRVVGRELYWLRRGPQMEATVDVADVTRIIGADVTTTRTLKTVQRLAAKLR